MKIVIQRAKYGRLVIDSELYSSIGNGMVVLVGVEVGDTAEDMEWICQKMCNLRIFDDQDGVMNLSLLETGGEVMIISQFTLCASTRKGKRPSYIKAAAPDQSKPMYHAVVQRVEQIINRPVATGIFGSDMKVELLNDGPVTIIIDSRNRV